MRPRILALAALVAAIAAGESRAAVLSSSNTATRMSVRTLVFNTQLRRGDNNGSLGTNSVGAAGIVSGSNLVALTVDTVADTVHYDDINFLPISMSSHTGADSTAVNYTVLATPANFPDPAVFMNVSGTYTSRITFNSFSAAGPEFSSSTTNAIVYPQNATSFPLRSNVTLTAVPNIVVSGTYEAIGPTTSVTRPFSITLTPSNVVSQATSITPGGPGFGNGFAFLPQDLRVSYTAPAMTILDQIIDNVRFTATTPTSLTLQFFEIPEPGCMILASGALACLAAYRRKR